MGTFLMGVLESINAVAALVQIVVWVVVLFVLWKKLEDKYE